MPKRILIADDHESVLRRVKGMIEPHPDWVVCGEAVNGREAVTKAHQLKPDLVLLDFAMPHLDGLKAAAEINRLLPQVPIVMFTMYGSELGDEVHRYGITRLVDKARSADLVAAVEELLATPLATIDESLERGPETSVPLQTPVLDANPKTEISPPAIRKAG